MPPIAAPRQPAPVPAWADQRREPDRMPASVTAISIRVKTRHCKLNAEAQAGHRYVETGSNSLPPLDVEFRDGCYCVKFGDGRLLPITIGNHDPVAAFNPGWKPRWVCASFAPIYLLELRHEDGQEATWFLDQRLNHLGDAVANLPQEAGALLRFKAGPIVARLLGQFLTRPEPILDEEARDFLALNQAIRIQIVDACQDVLPRPPVLIMATELPEEVPFPRARGDDPALMLKRAFVRAGLQTKLIERIGAALADGVLTWPSPVGEGSAAASGSLCIHDLQLAFRFVDREHDLVFFVLASGHDCVFCCLYIPALHLAVCDTLWQAHLTKFHCPDLALHIARHVFRHAAVLEEYFKPRTKRLAGFVRPPPAGHIGHHLWNELSGIEWLAECELLGSLSEFIVLKDEADVELYGKIDVLFPQLQGRMNRSIPNDRGHMAHLAAYAYSHHVLLVRPTSTFVTSRLRDRVRRHLKLTSVWQGLAALVPGCHRAIIVLGLRVENRTVVDLAEFCRRLIDFICVTLPDAIIVLDGHNVFENGATITSYREEFADRPPMEVEKELAFALHGQFEGRRISLVDNIGVPLQHSLAWADHADCFIAFWGAGLAKYRWVCNKPGLIISSRANLTGRGDLRIYSSDEFMESPSQVMFADPAFVHDEPDAPQLVFREHGIDGNNFSVNEDGLFGQVRELIGQFATYTESR